MQIPDAVLIHAERQASIVSRRQLYAAGMTRWAVRHHIAIGRWQRIGDQSVCLHTGPLATESHHWAAVFQGGPRACLDGATALIASGLERFDDDAVRVSVPRGARIRRTRAYDIRQTRRWKSEDIVDLGVPRTQPAVAAIRAALWARTDRAATYVLALVAQQGIASPEQLGEKALQIRRDRRRRLIHSVLNELLDGARALGEIDVARECRRRGLPEPARQVLRRDGQRRYYLDLYWPDYHLVVEVDGIHHAWAENVVGDALRQNALALDGDTVLRLPLLGLRLRPDEFFDQIAAGLGLTPGKTSYGA